MNLLVRPVSRYDSDVMQSHFFNVIPKFPLQIRWESDVGDSRCSLSISSENTAGVAGTNVGYEKARGWSVML